MKRKFISLFCAIAMIMSLFSSMVVVNAEDTKGMKLTLDEANSTDTVKVIDVSYYGMTEFNSLQFKLPLDTTMYSSIAIKWADEVQEADAKTSNIKNGALTGSVLDGILAMAASEAGITCPDGKFATITLTLNKALESDLTLSLEGLIMQGDKASEPFEGLVGESLTIKAPATPVVPIVTDRGMNLTLDEVNSTDTVKVIDVSYAGITEFNSLQFKLPLDTTMYSSIAIKWADEVQEADAKTSNIKNGALTGSVLDGILAMAASEAGITCPNGKFATITLTLNKPLESDLVLQLEGLIMQGDKASEPLDNLTGGNVIISASGVVTPTPVVTSTPVVTETPSITETPSVTEVPVVSADPRPTAMPVVTTEPTQEPSTEPTGAPVPTPIVVTKGMNLTLDEANSTDTVKVIDVNYVGMTEFNSLQFKLPLDTTMYSSIAIKWADEVQEADAKTSNIKNGALTGSVLDGILAMAASEAGITCPNGKFATITLTLKEELKDNLVLQLEGLIMQGDKATEPFNDISGGSIVLSPKSEPTPTPTVPVVTPTPEVTPAPEVVAEKKLGDIFKNVDSSKVTDESYITISVKNGNDNAVYGKDYVAKNGDQVLTEEEFFNTIWGYNSDVKPSDALDKISIVSYVDDLTVTGKVNSKEGGEALDSVENAPIKDETPSTPTPTPTVKPNEDGVTGTWNPGSYSSLTKNTKKTPTVTFNKIPKDATDIAIDVEVINNPSVVSATLVNANPTITEGTDAQTAKSNVRIQINQSRNTTTTVRATLTYKLGDEDREATADLTVKTKTSTSTSTGGGSSSGGSTIGGIIGTVTPTPAPSVPFTDLDQAPWATTAITYLYNNGLVNGRSATEFAPQGEITRAEFAKLILAAYGVTIAEGVQTSAYSDVVSGEWYTPYVLTAAQYGLVKGYDDGTFRPNALVSRQEMAVMMYRAATTFGTQLPAVNEAKTWTDNTIADWAAEAVNALQVAGVINGYEDGRFGGTDASTRAQAAQMIYNLYIIK